MTEAHNEQHDTDEQHIEHDEAAEAAESLPHVVEHVDENQIRHMVSEIKSTEQQVGEHILAALQDSDTIAVLTAIVVAPSGGQQIVSAALDAAMLNRVQSAMAQAQQERQEEVPCVGFHCYLKKKDQDDAGDNDQNKTSTEADVDNGSSTVKHDQSSDKTDDTSGT